MLDRVTDRRLPAAVLYPDGPRRRAAGCRCCWTSTAARGTRRWSRPGRRWLERQWWADAGFAVVTIDNRGTPGVAPSFEKAIHRRLADVILGRPGRRADRAGRTSTRTWTWSRVAIRGWSFGGWLAGLAVLRRPELFRCGIAGAPVTDWTLYDTAYTERYLGLPDDGDGRLRPPLAGGAGRRAGRPARTQARPMLLVHGLVDDNVVAAHTLRLSAALLATGRPHAVLPLTGATHMAAGGIAERLLRLELDFLRRQRL